MKQQLDPDWTFFFAILVLQCINNNNNKGMKRKTFFETGCHFHVIIRAERWKDGIVIFLPSSSSFAFYKRPGRIKKKSVYGLSLSLSVWGSYFTVLSSCRISYKCGELAPHGWLTRRRSSRHILSQRPSFFFLFFSFIQSSGVCYVNLCVSLLL